MLPKPAAKLDGSGSSSSGDTKKSWETSTTDSGISPSIKVCVNGSLVRKRVFRGRMYWERMKTCISEVKASCLNEKSCMNENDPRPFLKVLIAGEEMEGLLDSGASISCLGKGAIDWLEKHNLHWSRLVSSVRTADGNPQPVLGNIDVWVNYGDKSKLMRLYVVPGLSQCLYLGIDFWRTFGIVPMSIDGLSGELDCEPESKEHKLSFEQQQILTTVREQFPSFSVEGLGRTSLVSHVIDTGTVMHVR